MISAPRTLNALVNPLAAGVVIEPDVWGLQVRDGPQLLHTTFSNWNDLGFRQAYPGSYPGGSYPARSGAAENNVLGYLFGGRPHDSVYRLAFTFAHNDRSLLLDFLASGLQGIKDESWGIDNIEVSISTASLPKVISQVFIPLALK